MWESTHTEPAMRFVLLLLWSTGCVAVGMFLGAHPPGGVSPAEQLEQTLKKAPKLEQVREGAEDLVDGVKKKLAVDQRPVERHSEADRSAVDSLIAKRQKR